MPDFDHFYFLQPNINEVEELQMRLNENMQDLEIVSEIKDLATANQEDIEIKENIFYDAENISQPMTSENEPKPRRSERKRFPV